MTRVNTPLAAKSSPAAESQYVLTSTSKAPPSEAAKGPVDPSPELVIDYSRFRVRDNKSFMETWEEASKLNEEVARLQGEELSSLMALKMTHNVSFSPYSS